MTRKICILKKISPGFSGPFEVDWMKHMMDIFGGVYSYDSYLQVIPHLFH